jgi:hypothetical protein
MGLVTAGALMAASAMTLAACGGSDSKDKAGSAASTTTGNGATGAGSADKGASGATGGSGGAGAGTGGSGAAKGGKSGKGKKGRSNGNSGSSSGAGGNGSGGGKGDTTPQFGTLQERELYRQSKIVCRALSLKGLAHEYEVQRTPDAVAQAYAKGYAPSIRGAVFQGCKAAFVKQ